MTTPGEVVTLVEKVRKTFADLDAALKKDADGVARIDKEERKVLAKDLADDALALLAALT